MRISPKIILLHYGIGLPCVMESGELSRRLVFRYFASNLLLKSRLVIRGLG